MRRGKPPLISLDICQGKSKFSLHDFSANLLEAAGHLVLICR